jgi:CAAX protease family protein
MTATVLTLLLALAGPSALVLIGQRLFGDAPAIPAVVVLQIVFCAMAGTVFVVVTRVERQPLSSIGLTRPGRRTVVTIVLLVAASQALSVVTGPLVRAFVDPAFLAARTAPLMALPLWLRVFIAATSGVVEETLYRGYSIERLATLTGRRWMAGLMCAVLFGLAHIPAWGVAFALTADLPFGVLMTIFYLWRRDLVANGLVHSGGLIVALCF